MPLLQVLVLRSAGVPRSLFPVSLQSQLRTQLVLMLEELGRSYGRISGSIGIQFVSQRAIACLNGQYRDKRRPTDVLAFPLSDKGDRTVSGDVFICPAVVWRRTRPAAADFQGSRSPLLDVYRRRLSKLMAHGLVHLTGLDHHRSHAEAVQMHRLERALLDPVSRSLLQGMQRCGAVQ